MPDPNRALFESVVRLLDPVLDDLVFVGGCTIGLFVTDSVAGGIRPTKDVDAIVDVTSYAAYTSLAGRLRAQGLAEDSTPGVPLAQVRDRLGHASITTTERYDNQTLEITRSLNELRQWRILPPCDSSRLPCSRAN